MSPHHLRSPIGHIDIMSLDEFFNKENHNFVICVYLGKATIHITKCIDCNKETDPWRYQFHWQRVGRIRFPPFHPSIIHL